MGDGISILVAFHAE